MVRIAGGLVVSSFAWKLLHASEALEDQRAADDAQRSARPIDAFLPPDHADDRRAGLDLGRDPRSAAIARRPPASPHLALLGGAAICRPGRESRSRCSCATDSPRRSSRGSAKPAPT
ncbi:MAG: hypothetical protein WDO24_09690 [Pseudomonadota bacterium]